MTWKLAVKTAEKADEESRKGFLKNFRLLASCVDVEQALVALQMAENLSFWFVLMIFYIVRYWFERFRKTWRWPGWHEVITFNLNHVHSPIRELLSHESKNSGGGDSVEKLSFLRHKSTLSLYGGFPIEDVINVAGSSWLTFNISFIILSKHSF